MEPMFGKMERAAQEAANPELRLHLWATQSLLAWRGGEEVVGLEFADRVVAATGAERKSLA